MTKFFKQNRLLCIIVTIAFLCALAFCIFRYTDALSGNYSVAPGGIGGGQGPKATSTVAMNQIQGAGTTTAPLPPLDIAAYNAKLLEIANNPAPKPAPSSTTSSSSASSSAAANGSTIAVAKPTLWPVKTVYPDAGALLPFNRIVAYYGNFYSTQMGVLGQYPAPVMLQKLQAAVAEWQAADPSTPVIPALDYIAVTAQASAGADGKYRDRMPASQIEEALQLASQVNGLVFLDVQVGLSNLQTEVPLLEPYLKLPNVELSVDPEFSMKDGARPGTEIGTFDASDINFAANYLAGLVKQYNLPPKILVVHRFTQDMVTNYKEITPLPQVQFVMDMDGWGAPAKKLTTYRDFIAGEPVQFTGFKLFYKNDLLPPSTAMLTPAQILKLTPQPSYIQYQ